MSQIARQRVDDNYAAPVLSALIASDPQATPSPSTRLLAMTRARNRLASRTWRWQPPGAVAQVASGSSNSRGLAENACRPIRSHRIWA